MKARRAFVVLTLLLATAPTSQAGEKATGVSRFSFGRIFRSSSEKTKFKKLSGYPHGRPGYVIDYIVPLNRGGGDRAYNMQWLSKAEAKAKHKLERHARP